MTGETAQITRRRPPAPLLLVVLYALLAGPVEGAGVTVTALSASSTTTSDSATGTSTATSCSYDGSVGNYLSCEKSKISTGALIGAGVGVTLGIFVIAFGCICISKRRRMNNRRQAGTVSGGIKEIDDEDDEDEEGWETVDHKSGSGGGYEGIELVPVRLGQDKSGRSDPGSMRMGTDMGAGMRMGYGGEVKQDWGRRKDSRAARVEDADPASASDREIVLDQRQRSITPSQSQSRNGNGVQRPPRPQHPSVYSQAGSRPRARPSTSASGTPPSLPGVSSEQAQAKAQPIAIHRPHPPGNFGRPPSRASSASSRQSSFSRAPPPYASAQGGDGVGVPPLPPSALTRQSTYSTKGPASTIPDQTSTLDGGGGGGGGGNAATRRTGNNGPYAGSAGSRPPSTFSPYTHTTAFPSASRGQRRPSSSTGSIRRPSASAASFATSAASGAGANQIPPVPSLKQSLSEGLTSAQKIERPSHSLVRAGSALPTTATTRATGSEAAMNPVQRSGMGMRMGMNKRQSTLPSSSLSPPDLSTSPKPLAMPTPSPPQSGEAPVAPEPPSTRKSGGSGTAPLNIPVNRKSVARINLIPSYYQYQTLNTSNISTDSESEELLPSAHTAATPGVPAANAALDNGEISPKTRILIPALPSSSPLRPTSTSAHKVSPPTSRPSSRASRASPASQVSHAPPPGTRTRTRPRDPPFSRYVPRRPSDYAKLKSASSSSGSERASTVSASEMVIPPFKGSMSSMASASASASTGRGGGVGGEPGARSVGGTERDEKIGSGGGTTAVPGDIATGGEGRRLKPARKYTQGSVI